MRRLSTVVLLMLPLAAWAQSTALTEAQALRMGLARTEVAGLAKGALDAAEADVLSAAQLPNPTLAYTRERTKGSANASEENWQLTQTFDVSGRRALRREAAERMVDATAAGNATRHNDLSGEIRRRFHETLLRQEAVNATTTWTEHFARVEAIVDKLARAGEASGYDRRRLGRERQAAQARLATEQAALERVREQLAALVGLSGEPAATVAGTLLPQPLPPLEDSLTRIEQRPDLAALARRAEAAELEGRAASRGWVPDVTLGVGPKRTDIGGNRDSGVIATLSIPLPVFDRQQAGERRAAATALHARSELALARAHVQGELRGLHRQAERLRTAAADYRRQAAASSPELLRIAEAAYRGGESSLLELLDAYRGALEAETTALDLEWKAREARIDYDLLTGSITE